MDTGGSRREVGHTRPLGCRPHFHHVLAGGFSEIIWCPLPKASWLGNLTRYWWIKEGRGGTHPSIRIPTTFHHDITLIFVTLTNIKDTHMKYEKYSREICYLAGRVETNTLEQIFQLWGRDRKIYISCVADIIMSHYILVGNHGFRFLDILVIHRVIRTWISIPSFYA